jgi:hypothetical protein
MKPQPHPDSFRVFLKSPAGLACIASLLGVFAFFALLFAVLHDGKLDRDDLPVVRSSDDIPRSPIIVFVDGTPIIFP